LLLLAQKNQIEPYLRDASQFSGSADRVFLPENEIEIVELVKEAHHKKIPLTVSGGRTGLAGAAVPEGGWVLSTEKLTRVLEIKKEKKEADSWARLEPAVLLKDLDRALRPHGLFYPPDPTGPRAFLGGTVQTNASGPNSFKYGTTRRYIRRLRIVLADGEILDLRRGQSIADREVILNIPAPRGGNLKVPVPHYSFPRIKHAGGYFAQPAIDAVDLFIGSEGTLGVVTEIELALLPRPREVLAFVVFFSKEEDAWRLSQRARDSKTVQPRMLEYFDGGSLQFLRPDFPSIPKAANACLFIEQEVDGDSPLLGGLSPREGTGYVDVWEARTADRQEEFRNFRSALPLAVKDFLAQHGQVKIGTDTAVPHDRFQELMLFHRKKIEEGGFQSVTFGHIGESHVHLNILPQSEAEAQRARNLYPELVRKALALGGTFSAEHGVGKLKRPYLIELLGKEAVGEMAAIKRILDPHLILGQGNIFEIQ